MARRLLTLDEVVEEVQKSDSEDELSGNEDEVSGNEDESEDDFDGYIYEEEVGQRWEMDVQGNGSDVEGDGSDVGGDGSDEEGDGSDQGQSGSDQGQSSSDEDMDTVQPYTLESGCSVSFPENRPIDYFSQFVDESMLQHIVDQTKLYSEQFRASHTLTAHSRVRKWLKEEHTIAELQRFIALLIVMGIVRYP